MFKSYIYNEFVERLSKEVKKLKIGNSLDSDVNIGPLINQDGLDKVMRHVDDAVDKGATIVTGGKRSGEKDSLYYEPTVIRDIDEDRKSTRLNSSHVAISYAVFCLKKKKQDVVEW